MIKTRYGSEIILEAVNLDAGCCVFRYPDGAKHLGYLCDLRATNGLPELVKAAEGLPKPSCKNCSDGDCPFKEKK